MLAELIDRIEKAGEPSRELDEAILLAVNQERHRYCEGRFRETLARAEANGLTNRREACWRDAFSGEPRYTGSIDAAVSLVPDGYHWSYDSLAGTAEVTDNGGRFLVESDREFFARGVTPAIAICIAALRARKP